MNLSYDVSTARADGLFVAIDKMKLQNNQINDGDTTTTTTPSTSASSSPSLPPSTPPSDVPPLTSTSHSNTTEDAADANSQEESAWVAPPSKKSLRTHNPIRAIVDPIMASSIKCGKERGDGKDQISLAVSIL